MRPGLLLALVLLTGCTHWCPAGSYGYNRGKDLTEALHVGLHGPSIGGVAHAGPMILGRLDALTFETGIKSRQKIGFGGKVRERHEKSIVTGVLWPISFGSNEHYREGNHSRYKALDVGWGAVGVGFGWVYGVDFRFDLLEWIDFLAGLFQIDLLGDDPEGEDLSGERPTVREDMRKESS